MATSYSSPRIFMDPVHGSIELEGYLVRIIDTPEFQRLRKIKQLSACYVYPGATHTRFEHSIGVCHIASELIKGINNNSVGTLINKEEEVCIKIAALCHDIGHGPYSHLYDSAVSEYFEEKLKTNDEKKKFTGNEEAKLPKEASHEYRSAAIVEVLSKRQEVKESIVKHLNGCELVYTYEIYIDLIQRMITFSEDFKKTKPTKEAVTVSDKDGKKEEKSYLFEIVANAFTGIDVDKMDYFARDSRSVGLPNSFDWRRYTHATTIIKCSDDEGFHHICSRDKDAAGLYELFHTRTLLYRTVYKHKTVVIIEHMIKEAMIAANLKVRVKGLKESWPLLECWKDMDAFRYLTDSFIEEIIMTGADIDNGVLKVDRDMIEAQKWFERINNRQIPKFFTESKSCVMKDNCKRTMKVRRDAEEEVEKKYIFQKRVKFNYGKEGHNPMERHYFYRKWKPEEPFQLKKEEVSAILPAQFEEIKYFWYYDEYEHKRKNVLQSLRDRFTPKQNNKSEKKEEPPPTECTCPED